MILGIVASSINKATNLFEFDATLTTQSAGTLANVTGTSWTVVRNSVANYESDSGLVVEVAAHVPRIQDGKVLIEGASTNLFTFSEEFDDDDWDKRHLSTVTANSVTSPDNTTNADTYTAGNENNGGTMRRQPTIADSTTYYMSFYIKKQNWRYIGLRISDASVSDTYNYYDFDTDSIDNTVVSGATITRKLMGNSWVKITQEYTTGVAAQDLIDFNITASDGDTAFIPAGTEEVYMWGAKLSTDLSSYIKDNNTRAADVITNTVPTGGTWMETWIEGVSDGGQAVTQGNTITMENGTTKIVIT